MEQKHLLIFLLDSGFTDLSSRTMNVHKQEACGKEPKKKCEEPWGLELSHVMITVQNQSRIKARDYWKQLVTWPRSSTGSGQFSPAAQNKRTCIFEGHPHLRSAHRPRVIQVVLLIDGLHHRKHPLRAPHKAGASTWGFKGQRSPLTKYFCTFFHRVANSPMPSFPLPLSCWTLKITKVFKQEGHPIKQLINQSAGEPADYMSADQSAEAHQLYC